MCGRSAPFAFPVYAAPSKMATPTTPQKAPLVKVVVLGDAGYACRCIQKSGNGPFSILHPQNGNLTFFSSFLYSLVVLTVLLLRVGKTSLLQRYVDILAPDDRTGIRIRHFTDEMYLAML